MEKRCCYCTLLILLLGFYLVEWATVWKRSWSSASNTVREDYSPSTNESSVQCKGQKRQVFSDRIYLGFKHSLG